MAGQSNTCAGCGKPTAHINPYREPVVGEYCSVECFRRSQLAADRAVLSERIYQVDADMASLQQNKDRLLAALDEVILHQAVYRQ